MKKVFTLLTLALMAAQSVKADVVQWAVSDAPAVGTAFQVKQGSDEIIQVAFGAMNSTKTDAEATNYTTGDGNVDVTYSGTKYSFTKYASTSATNGSDSDKLKADGTSEANYMAFVPKYNGVLVIVVQNNGGKPTCLYEDGVQKAATLIGSGSASIAFSGKEDLKSLNGNKNYSGGISLPVKAGSTYTISVSGSKGRWEGFIYDYNTSGVVKPVASFSEDKLNVLPEASVSEPTLSIKDLDGNDISSYFSVTYSSDNEKVAKVDASTGEISLVSNNEGTAVITVKLTSNDAEKYEDAEAKYTITVASEITYPYTWDFTTFETSGTWENLAADAKNWGFKDENESTYQSLVEMKGTIAAGGVTIPETKFIKFGTFGTNKIYINKNSLQLNGKTLTITIPDLTAGYYVSIDFENPSGSESRGFKLTNVNEKESSDEIKLAASTRETRTFTVKEDGDVALTSTSGIRIYGISVTTEAPTVTVITTNGYATFSSAAAVDFSESGAEVYTASVDGNNAVLTKVEGGKVPANTGVIIKAESETVVGKCIYNASALEGNQLIAATKEVSEKGIYILVADGESVKFTTMTSGALNAGKAYLPAATTSEARELNLVVGNATGISEVNAAGKLAELYNLNGVRVSQPVKGLYIQNGKKIIVK